MFGTFQSHFRHSLISQPQWSYAVLHLNSRDVINSDFLEIVIKKKQGTGHFNSVLLYGQWSFWV
jgi:hypothetical protein